MPILVYAQPNLDASWSMYMALAVIFFLSHIHLYEWKWMSFTSDHIYPHIYCCLLLYIMHIPYIYVCLLSLLQIIHIYGCLRPPLCEWVWLSYISTYMTCLKPCPIIVHAHCFYFRVCSCPQSYLTFLFMCAHIHCYVLPLIATTMVFMYISLLSVLWWTNLTHFECERRFRAGFQSSAHLKLHYSLRNS